MLGYLDWRRYKGLRTTVLRAVKVRCRGKGLVVESPGEGNAVGTRVPVSLNDPVT